MFDLCVVCSPVKEERSCHQGSWSPSFFHGGELQERRHVPAGLPCRPSGAPAGFKVLLSPNDNRCSVSARCA